ncbi:protein DMP4-like [Lycium barbarum]|uniref:protein DMP4-like n=1 Tax=Lycium barbarum TaxID=112863 RepID=UPI00293EF284|nr:protein DMP4-like [Lycium barbarum]
MHLELTHNNNSNTNLKKSEDMEIKVEEETSQNLDQERKSPLLEENLTLPEVEKNLIQKAITQTFQSTAHLANLLPTGSVLAFQLLSPIFTNQGHCDKISQLLTIALVGVCGLSCFILSFTDSFTDKKGKICYGLATIRGLWIIDGSARIPHQIAKKYKLKFIDFLHGFMSVLVFAAVALFDQNVVNCFYPKPSDQTEELLTALPVAIGVICSMFFVVFPTKRHGIGFPLTSN